MMRFGWSGETHQSDLEIIPLEELQPLAQEHLAEENWKFPEQYLSNIHKYQWA
jgi:hypothetical protein